MQVAPFIIVLPFKPFSFSNLKKAEGGGETPPPLFFCPKTITLNFFNA